MNKLILGITGSKTYENKLKIKEFIFKLRSQTKDSIQIVGLGDKNGADQHIKKYALEFGYDYKEMNPPHTVKNLYSLMSEGYYAKPYNPRSHHGRMQIYAQYVHKCVVFNDNNNSDTKITNLIKQFSRVKKRVIILES